MKPRRPLPNLDLARVAPLPKDEKRILLRAQRDFFPPYSYDPSRSHILDLLNVQAGPLSGPAPRTRWDTIAKEISKSCRRGEKEIKVNLEVSNALYRFAESLNSFGRRHHFFNLDLGGARSVQYWSPLVVSLGDVSVVPFIDPRRAKKLTPAGRKFVHSVMNEHIRVPDPDFSEIQMAIIQFGEGSDGARIPRMYLDDPINLYSFEELDRMVAETYEVWHEILDERDEDLRRRGTGTGGSLL